MFGVSPHSDQFTSSQIYSIHLAIARRGLVLDLLDLLCFALLRFDLRDIRRLGQLVIDLRDALR